MEKNRSLYLWGDCPGLDREPKSREHEERFKKLRQVADFAIKKQVILTADIKNVQNRAKWRGIV